MRSAVDIVLTLTRCRELGNEPLASGKGKLTENGIKEEPKTNGQTLDGEDEHPNLLLRYDIIIIDEAHERTLNTDFLLGSLKLIQAERKRLTREIEAAKAQRGERGSSGEVDVLQRTWGGYQMRELKIVVMSATLEADVFSNFFDK
jgi:HrpA-like RNA helicase